MKVYQGTDLIINKYWLSDPDKLDINELKYINTV